MMNTAKKRASSIVTEDQWLIFLAKNKTETSEKMVQQFTNAPQETEEECWYENDFRHALYLVAEDRFARLCTKAGVNVPNEETRRNLAFHKKLFVGCDTEAKAIARLQAIAKRLHWQ